MITAKFSTDADSGSLTMRIVGHSGSAPRGQDLICAGMSTLAITCAQLIRMMHSEEKLKKPPHITIRDGSARITAVPKDADYAECLHCMYMAEVGASVMAASYPENVIVIPFDISDKECQ